MRTPTRLLLVTTIAAALGGCASGGGSGGGGTYSELPVSSSGQGGGHSDVPVTSPSTGSSQLSSCAGLGCLFGGSGGDNAGMTNGLVADSSLCFSQFCADGSAKTVQEMELPSPLDTPRMVFRSEDGTLLLLGDPTLSGRWFNRQTSTMRVLPERTAVAVAEMHTFGAPGGAHGFTMQAGNANAIGLAANAKAHGWDYQTFGVWYFHDTGVLPRSYGTLAPQAPLFGEASFTGSLAGLYVSPSGEKSVAHADVKVNVDFQNRSVALSTFGTALTRDMKANQAAPSLDLRGTFTYAPGSVRFQGSVANVGGTMAGKGEGAFYGAGAKEVGGTVSLKSVAGTPESLGAAFGAKR